MPLTNVLENTINSTPTGASYGPLSVPQKRPTEDAGDVEEAGPAKRPRQLDQPAQTVSESSSSNASSSQNASNSNDNPMPPPCDTYIQLRFQLCRFKGVYRVARLPLTCTFAHLYQYILLIFGWSGAHLHKAEVLTHTELYSGAYRPGEIKKHRTFRIPEEPNYKDDLREWQQWSLFYAKCSHDPAMRVSPSGRSYEDAWMGKDSEPLNMDDPYDRVWAETRVPSKKDAEVTLGDVWSWKSKDNISKGDCSNENIGIAFEYDLGASWLVHITPESSKERSYMWKERTPRSYPVLVTAKGAPPTEDARSYSKDTDPKKKTVPDLLFDPNTFERFLNNEICSVVRNTELAVYKTDQPPASVLEEDQSEDEDEDDWED